MGKKNPQETSGVSGNSTAKAGDKNNTSNPSNPDSGSGGNIVQSRTINSAPTVEPQQLEPAPGVSVSVKQVNLDSNGQAASFSDSLSGARLDFTDSCVSADGEANKDMANEYITFKVAPEKGKYVHKVEYALADSAADFAFDKAPTRYDAYINGAVYSVPNTIGDLSDKAKKVCIYVTLKDVEFVFSAAPAASSAAWGEYVADTGTLVAQQKPANGAAYTLAASDITTSTKIKWGDTFTFAVKGGVQTQNRDGRYIAGAAMYLGASSATPTAATALIKRGAIGTASDNATKYLEYTFDPRELPGVMNDSMKYNSSTPVNIKLDFFKDDHKINVQPITDIDNTSAFTKADITSTWLTDTTKQSYIDAVPASATDRSVEKILAFTLPVTGSSKVTKVEAFWGSTSDSTYAAARTAAVTNNRFLSISEKQSYNDGSGVKSDAYLIDLKQLYNMPGAFAHVR